MNEEDNEDDYDFVNMSEAELEDLSYSGNLEFKYLSEEELSQISARVPDEVYLAALNICALQKRMYHDSELLNNICHKYNIRPHNAMLAVSAVEQSFQNDLQRQQKAEEWKFEQENKDAACDNSVL